MTDTRNTFDELELELGQALNEMFNHYPGTSPHGMAEERYRLTRYELFVHHGQAFSISDANARAFVLEARQSKAVLR
jgi:hypothetical protein